MSEFFKLFGIYDLKEEGRKWCIREFGEQYGDEYVEKYEAINKGIPIGDMYETMVFIDMVETIKRELKEKTIKQRIRKLFGISEQLKESA